MKKRIITFAAFFIASSLMMCSCDTPDTAPAGNSEISQIQLAAEGTDTEHRK